jgi:hypothetical protein
MQNVVYDENRFSNWYAECRYAECRGTVADITFKNYKILIVDEINM